MAGLLLNLKPYERFVIGGIVLQNGQRRNQIRVLDEEAGVLRLSDALHPNQVQSPLTRAYYVAQTILSGDTPRKDGLPVLVRLLDEAANAFAGFSLSPPIEAARTAAAEGQIYHILKLLKPLLPKEAAALYQLAGDNGCVNE